MAILNYLVKHEDVSTRPDFTSTAPPRIAQATKWSALAPTYAMGLNLLRGEQLPTLRSDIDAIFSGNTAAGLKRHARVMNITKRVTYRRAMVYKEFPTFEGPSKLVKGLTPDLGGWLKQADRVSDLCGLCWVAPDMQGDILGLTVLAPDQAEPIWTGNGDEVEALRIYTQAMYDGKLRVITTTWTDDTWTVTVEGKNVTAWAAGQRKMGGGFAKGVNDWGVIPFAPMRSELPVQGDENGVPNLVLINQQRVLNLNLTYLGALIRLQTCAQAVYKGNKPPAVIKLGMMDAVHVKEELQGQSSFSYELPGVDVQGVWAVIRGDLETIYQEHLGGDWFTLAAAPSGVAMDTNNAGLEETRVDKWDAHRSFWYQFGRIAGRMMNLSDSADLTVKFGNQKVHEDSAVVTKRWQDQIAADVARPEEWVQELHPDWTDAQCKKYYGENVAASGERNKALRPTAPNLAAFMSENMNPGGTNPADDADAE
jgi:hypothetical protein